jgi:uncharacterized protein (DUF983 family)
MAKSNFTVRVNTFPKDLIRLCPECGSGDVRWCAISARPYCVECHTWGGVNFGSAEDAVKAWNKRVSKETV